MKSNAPIDILRLIISFMVVAIHCGVADVSENVYNMFQSAVPLFFVISGYFIENKCIKGGYVRDYISKSCRLYLYWCFIYFPLTIYGCIVNERIWWQDIIFTVRGYLVTGENFCSYPLWYLLATIYAVWMYRYTISHKWSDKKLFVFTFILTFIGFALEYFSSIKAVNNFLFIFGGTRTGIFQGFSYLIIGVFIARYNISDYCRRHKTILWFIWMVLLPISSYFPVPKSLFVDHFLNGLLISLLLASNFKHNFDTKPIRSIGVWIYFTHMYIVFIINQMFGLTDFTESIIYALPLSLCIAIVLYFIGRKFKYVRVLSGA